MLLWSTRCKSDLRDKTAAGHKSSQAQTSMRRTWEVKHIESSTYYICSLTYFWTSQRNLIKIPAIKKKKKKKIPSLTLLADMTATPGFGSSPLSICHLALRSCLNFKHGRGLTLRRGKKKQNNNQNLPYHHELEKCDSNLKMCGEARRGEVAQR